MINKEINDILLNIIRNNFIPNANTVIMKLISFRNQIGMLEEEDVFGTGKEEIDVVAEHDENRRDIIDHRVKTLTFRHFRSIPKGLDKPYGICFTDVEDRPISLFLVGSNGVGKTTIFSALERHYLSDTSLSKEKNLEEKKVLTYGFGQIKGVDTSAPILSVATMAGDFNEHLDDKESYCSPASFCSEYDLVQLGKKGNDLSEYILVQLGFGGLKMLREKLEELMEGKQNDLKVSVEYTSELNSADIDVVIMHFLKVHNKSKELLEIAARYGSLYNFDFGLFDQGMDNYAFKEKWEILKNLNKENENLEPAVIATRPKQKHDMSSKKEDVEKQLKLMYALLEDALKKCNVGKNGLLSALDMLFVKRHKLIEKSGRGLFDEQFNKKTTEELNILHDIISQIKNEENKIVKQFAQERSKMIRDILGMFSNTELELFIPDDVDPDEFRFEIRKNGEKDGFRATPQEYYNSFRYKLYAVSFKIALAFMEMNLKNIRIPVVIDDVFNASDFENNMRLEQFVYNIYKAYDNMKFQEPLQLILLTHDEMVLNAFRKGADLMIDEKFVNDEKQVPKIYQCGRLFSYEYAEEMAKELNGNCNSVQNSFYNLYMPI